jgi:hypothetical protein
VPNRAHGNNSSSGVFGPTIVPPFVHGPFHLGFMSTGMFTFQGDYKRRAQVNLGRTKHEDKASLLKKAHEERKAREEKRRREIAAMKIQVQISIVCLDSF